MHKRTIKPKYINLQGNDSDTTGLPSLYTTAYTKIDIEWNGIDFYAKSTCNGSSPLGEEETCGGDYIVDAWVINQTPDLKIGTWEGSIIRKAERSDFDWWDDGGIGDIEGEGDTKEERKRDKEEKQKAAIYALLSSTDANYTARNVCPVPFSLARERAPIGKLSPSYLCFVRKRIH